MKAKNITLCSSFGAATFTGAVILMAFSAPAQNLFVSTYTGDSIIEITPGGTQTTFANGLNYPSGLAFDSMGDLFVANSANNGAGGSITEITPDGTNSTFATGINPQGIAFNRAGDLFEADYNSGNIYEFRPDGTRSTFAAGFTLPLSLAFDPAGNLFVGDGTVNGSITKISPSGAESTIATGLSYPLGLAFNKAGDLFVANNGNGVITEITPTGRQSTFATGLKSPNTLAFDSDGDLFVTTYAGPVFEYASDGLRRTFATISGDPQALVFFTGKKAGSQFVLLSPLPKGSSHTIHKDFKSGSSTASF